MGSSVEERFRKYMMSLGIGGEFLLGGSTRAGEATSYSDVDCYAIVDSFPNLIRLLRKKKSVQEWVAEQGIPLNIICLTRWSLRWKFYYVAAQHENGEYVCQNIDWKRMRNTALKLAYRELGSSNFDLSEKEGYHVSKALVYAIHAIGLSQGIVEAREQPLFTVAGAQRILSVLPLAPEKDTVQEILEARAQGSFVPVTEQIRNVVSRWMEMAWDEYQKDSFAWRSYVIYALFSLRYPRLFPFVMGNPDTYILKSYREAIRTKNAHLFHTIKKDTFQILVI